MTSGHTDQASLSEDLLGTALQLHATGMSVIPVRADTTKRPALPSWKEHQQTPATAEDLARWFAGTPAPHQAIGVVTGPVSGNLELLEIEGDYVHLMDQVDRVLAESNRAELWDRINAGWVEASPSGGWHWLVRVEGQDVPGNTVLASDEQTTPEGHRTRPTIAETRGRGGYVIVAPTAGQAHPTGNPWVRTAGGPTTVPTITAEEREDLHAAFRMLNRAPRRDTTPAPARSSTGVDAGGRPGDQFEATDWADILGPAGWQVQRQDGRTTYWTRPGKSTAHGASATTGHAEDRDRLWVFTTSTDFDPDIPYTKFGAYAVLHYGGDHAAAAAGLRAGQHTPDGERFGSERDRTRWTEAQLREWATTGTASPGLNADPPPAAEHAPTPPSWAPVDLTAYLDGTHEPTRPALMARTDGEHLLYPGKVHSFHGESESGKSMLATAVAATELQAGHPVLYLDYEDDAATIIDRLTRMGCTPEQVRAYLHYLNPEVDPTTGPAEEVAAWFHLLENTYRLAIIDGVTEAFAVSGVTSIDNDEVTTWGRAVPKKIAARTGAAVVVIDHVTKAAEGRGRFAIGAQAKMNYLTGAAYTVEVIEPLGTRMRGRLSLRVGKDRPGQVRPISYRWRKSDRTQEAAVVTIDSTDPARIVTTVDPPPQEVDFGEVLSDRQEDLKQKIGDWVRDKPQPPSFNRIRQAVTGRDQDIKVALDALVAGGFIRTTLGPNKSTLHHHVRNYPGGSGSAPYREGGGNQFREPLEPPGNHREPGTTENREPLSSEESTTPERNTP